MSRNLAYVFGSARNQQTEAEAQAGKQPRAEYQVFAEHYPVTLFDLNAVGSLSHPLIGLFSLCGKTTFVIAASVLRQRQYDGLLATGEDIGLPLALLAPLFRNNNPIYIITHGSYAGSPRFAFLMKWLRRQRSIHFLCLSDSLRRLLVEEFHVPSSRAHNCSYGTDTTYFQPQGTVSSSSKPLIVSAGAANRDYQTLVDAVSPLGVDVQIAAGSAWFPTPTKLDMNALPSRLTVQSRNYEELRDLYAACSFVVVPLYPARHACGYAVIADAMAMGKAVIATRTEHISDFIIEGQTGYYVEPGNVDQLREKIAFLLAHPKEAARLGCAARAHIEGYSVETYVQRIQKVVQGS